uniref:Uncharacterized protein n=1 Tax=Anopheles atroparvus TaxID=41427 RepID=A0A182JE84_ANOAO
MATGGGLRVPMTPTTGTEGPGPPAGGGRSNLPPIDGTGLNGSKGSGSFPWLPSSEGLSRMSDAVSGRDMAIPLSLLRPICFEEKMLSISSLAGSSRITGTPPAPGEGVATGTTDPGRSFASIGGGGGCAHSSSTPPTVGSALRSFASSSVSKRRCSLIWSNSSFSRPILSTPPSSASSSRLPGSPVGGSGIPGRSNVPSTIEVQLSEETFLLGATASDRASATFTTRGARVPERDLRGLASRTDSNFGSGMVAWTAIDFEGTFPCRFLSLPFSCYPIFRLPATLQGDRLLAGTFFLEPHGTLFRSFGRSVRLADLTDAARVLILQLAYDTTFVFSLLRGGLKAYAERSSDQPTGQGGTRFRPGTSSSSSFSSPAPSPSLTFPFCVATQPPPPLIVAGTIAEGLPTPFVSPFCTTTFFSDFFASPPPPCGFGGAGSSISSTSELNVCFMIRRLLRFISCEARRSSFSSRSSFSPSVGRSLMIIPVVVVFAGTVATFLALRCRLCPLLEWVLVLLVPLVPLQTVVAVLVLAVGGVVELRQLAYWS